MPNYFSYNARIREPARFADRLDVWCKKEIRAGVSNSFSTGATSALQLPSKGQM